MLPPHCMIAYNEGEDICYGQMWDQEVGQQKVQLVPSHAIMESEGVALAIETK